MRLADYQRAILAASFDGAARDAPLPGFSLYRDMIRGRLFAMARVAFRRSWARAGHGALEASFARYLAESPPRSPRIREVIGAFATFAREDRTLLRDAPADLADLLAFEGCAWSVASAPVPESGDSPRELDFEGALVLNPTLALLPLAHVVTESMATPCRDPHVLLVYRRPGEDDVRWYRAESALAEVLTHARAAPARLGDLVRRVLARDGTEPVVEVVEAFVAALGIALERQVVLGVLPLPP